VGSAIAEGAAFGVGQGAARAATAHAFGSSNKAEDKSSQPPVNESGNSEPEYDPSNETFFGSAKHPLQWKWNYEE